MNIKITTDSSCDLPEKILEQYNVGILPLYIIRDQTTYRDGIDITPEKLYHDMRGGVTFRTSQIPYQDFVNKFTEFAEKGQPFIHLCFSSGLSGTYQTALIAKRDVKEKYPEVQMEVVDTKAATGGLGLIVRQIAKLAYEGADFETLIKETKRAALKVRHVFTVDNLEYLYRGGRLNKGTALVGNMLKMKPVLEINKQGELGQVDKIRTEQKLIKRIINYIEENGSDIHKQPIVIAHGDDLAMAERFAKKIGEYFNTRDFITIQMSPTIGAHTGPGSIAFCYFEKV